MKAFKKVLNSIRSTVSFSRPCRSAQRPPSGKSSANMVAQQVAHCIADLSAALARFRDGEVVLVQAHRISSDARVGRGRIHDRH
jgi:hypothetical protein